MVKFLFYRFFVFETLICIHNAKIILIGCTIKKFFIFFVFNATFLILLRYVSGGGLLKGVYDIYIKYLVNSILI